VRPGPKPRTTRGRPGDGPRLPRRCPQLRSLARHHHPDRRSHQRVAERRRRVPGPAAPAEDSPPPLAPAATSPCCRCGA